MTPDINILVAAFRPDHQHHKAARRWLTAALAAAGTGVSLRLLPPVVAGFLRLVTNSRIFANPDAIEDALAFVDGLLATPGVDIPATGEEWPHLRQACLHGKLRGNDIPDAWLAACVLRLGEHLVTFDAGFGKLLRREHLTVLNHA